MAFDMKQLKNTRGTYFFTFTWIERDKSWVSESQGWDGQWYFQILDSKNNQVGEAAFVDAAGSAHISPCDFCDLAMEIDEAHRRRGIATSIIFEAEKLAGKPLKQRSDESTEEGDALMKKLGVPFDL